MPKQAYKVVDVFRNGKFQHQRWVLMFDQPTDPAETWVTPLKPVAPKLMNEKQAFAGNYVFKLDQEIQELNK